VTYPKCLKAHAEGVTLQLWLQPSAKISSVVGFHGDDLKLKISAPAVDGKANETLISFIADCFAVRAKQVSLLSGLKNRQKVILIAGLSLADAAGVVERLVARAGHSL
jgi:hypothetical protein